VGVRNGDEDALTMAVEAAQALPGLGRVDEVLLAVGRPDLVDGPQPQTLRAALGLPTGTPGATFAGDALAGLAALTSAADAIDAGRAETVLVVASEPGDGVRVSAAAVALLVGRGGPAVRVLDRHDAGDVVHGNWVDRAGARHPGDLRHLEHTVTALARRVRSTGPAPDGVTGVAAAAVARALGAAPDAVLPDHGVAGPLLALLRTAGSPGTTGDRSILAATASQVVAVHAEADPGAPAWSPPPEPDAGPPTEAEASPPLSLPTSSPFFQRAAGELLRLEGARCRRCGTTAFPPSQRPVCSGCQGYDFDPVPLSRTGAVHTFVVNRFLPEGFGDEMTLVLGEMDDGSRYWAPTSGIRPGELAIGDRVGLRLRRFTDHGGAPVYAMKFTGASA
jgi:uncharacterized OB-fold protein